MTLIEALRRHSTLFVFSAAMAVGIVPLVIFRAGGFADPYDEPLSHLWWIAGFVGLGSVSECDSPSKALESCTSLWTRIFNGSINNDVDWVETCNRNAELMALSLIFTLLYGISLALINEHTPRFSLFSPQRCWSLRNRRLFCWAMLG